MRHLRLAALLVVLSGCAVRNQPVESPAVYVPRNPDSVEVVSRTAYLENNNAVSMVLYRVPADRKLVLTYFEAKRNVTPDSFGVFDLYCDSTPVRMSSISASALTTCFSSETGLIFTPGSKVILSGKRTDGHLPRTFEYLMVGYLIPAGTR